MNPSRALAGALALSAGLLPGCSTVVTGCRDAAKYGEVATLKIPRGEKLAAVIRIQWSGYAKEEACMKQVFLDGIEIRHESLADGGKGVPGSGDCAMPVYRSDRIDWAKPRHRVRVVAGFGTVEEDVEVAPGFPVPEFQVSCGFRSAWEAWGGRGVGPCLFFCPFAL